MDRLLDLDKLNRELLHVFVVGPGEGEGIAIALPGSGWVLIDGCATFAKPRRREEGLPLREILRRWSAGPEDRLLAMILTHPHEDHANGFADVLNEFKPQVVGVTGTDPTSRTLVQQAEALVKAKTSSTPRSRRTKQSQVVTAIQGIAAWRAAGGTLVALHDGQSIPLGAGAPATADARSPDPDIFNKWTDAGRLLQIMLTQANRLSVVLELAFGDTRVVLGADLPVRDGAGVVPTGWGRVLEEHPQLKDHACLKVPHHGSVDALHGDLIAEATDGRHRVWVLTPYNSSGLPRTDPDDGVDQLLECTSPIHLTAPSVSKKLLAALNAGRLTAPELQELVDRLRAKEAWSEDETLIDPGTALEPLDPIWGVALDGHGEIQALWRGRAACEVRVEPESASDPASPAP